MLFSACDQLFAGAAGNCSSGRARSGSGMHSAMPCRAAASRPTRPSFDAFAGIAMACRAAPSAAGNTTPGRPFSSSANLLAVWRRRRSDRRSRRRFAHRLLRKVPLGGRLCWGRRRSGCRLRRAAPPPPFRSEQRSRTGPPARGGGRRHGLLVLRAPQLFLRPAPPRDWCAAVPSRSCGGSPAQLLPCRPGLRFPGFVLPSAGSCWSAGPHCCGCPLSMTKKLFSLAAPCAARVRLLAVDLGLLAVGRRLELAKLIRRGPASLFAAIERLGAASQGRAQNGIFAAPGGCGGLSLRGRGPCPAAAGGCWGGCCCALPRASSAANTAACGHQRAAPGRIHPLPHFLPEPPARPAKTRL